MAQINELFNDTPGHDLQYIDSVDQTPELCLREVTHTGTALKYVAHQSPEICMAAVQQDGRALEYVQVQTPELCMAAVQKSGWALEYVQEQTPEICLAAMQQDGSALQFVRKQTAALCMAAVRQDGLALQWVKVQTPEIHMAAVQQDGQALYYIENQSQKLCKAAVQQNPLVLQYVKTKFQTSELCLEAVRQNGLALKFVEKQTPEICTAAIAQNNQASTFVIVNANEKVASSSTISSTKTPTIIKAATETPSTEHDEEIQTKVNIFERIVKSLISKVFMVNTVPLGVWLKMHAGNLIAKLSFERKEKMGVKLMSAMIKAPELLNENFGELKRKGFIQGGVTEKELEIIKLKVLDSKPEYIQYMTDPNYEQIHKAVSKNPQTYLLINQNKSLTENLLKSDNIPAELIGYAKEQTQGLCEIALNKDIKVCERISKEAMSAELCLYALTKNPEALYHIKKESLSKTTLDYAIEQNPEVGFLLSNTPNLQEKFQFSNNQIAISPTAAMALKRAANHVAIKTPTVSQHLTQL